MLFIVYKTPGARTERRKTLICGGGFIVASVSFGLFGWRLKMLHIKVVSLPNTFTGYVMLKQRRSWRKDDVKQRHVAFWSVMKPSAPISLLLSCRCQSSPPAGVASNERTFKGRVVQSWDRAAESFIVRKSHIFLSWFFIIFSDLWFKNVFEPIPHPLSACTECHLVDATPPFQYFLMLEGFLINFFVLFAF